MAIPRIALHGMEVEINLDNGIFLASTQIPVKDGGENRVYINAASHNVATALSELSGKIQVASSVLNFANPYGDTTYQRVHEFCLHVSILAGEIPYEERTQSAA